MLTLNFNPFPTLHTERFILKALAPEDAVALAAMRSHARVNEFLDRPKQISLEYAQQYIERIIQETAQNECIVWSIHYRKKPGMLGSICYWNIVPEADTAEIGYEMHPDHYGRGIMHEAMQAVIPYAFNILQLKKIVALPVKENIKSISLLERNGFTRDLDIEKYALTEQQKDVTAIYILSKAPDSNTFINS